MSTLPPADKTIELVKHDPNFTTEYPRLVRQGVTNHMVNAGLRIDSFDEATTSVVLQEDVAKSVLACMAYFSSRYGKHGEEYRSLGISVTQLGKSEEPFLPPNTALSFNAKQVGKFASEKQNATFVFRVRMQSFRFKEHTAVRVPVGAPVEVEYTLEKRYVDKTDTTTYNFSFRGDNPLAINGGLNVFNVSTYLLNSFTQEAHKQEGYTHPELRDEVSFLIFQLKTPFIIFSHLMLRSRPDVFTSRKKLAKYRQDTYGIRYLPNASITLDKLTLSRYVKFNAAPSTTDGPKVDTRQQFLRYLNTVYNVVRPDFKDNLNNGIESFRGIKSEVFIYNADSLHSDTHIDDVSRALDLRKFAKQKTPKISGVRLVRSSVSRHVLNSIYFSLPFVKGRGVQNLDSEAANSLEQDYLKVTFTLHAKFFYDNKCKSIADFLLHLGVDLDADTPPTITKFRDNLDAVLASQFEAYDFSYWLTFSYIKSLSVHGRESLLADMEKHKRHKMKKFFEFWSNLEEVNESPAYSNALTIYLKLFHEKYWNEESATGSLKELMNAKQYFRQMVKDFKRLYGIDITYPMSLHKQIVGALYQSTQKMEDVFDGKVLQDTSMQAKELMRNFSSLMAVHSWQASALTMASTVNKTRTL